MECFVSTYVAKKWRKIKTEQQRKKMLGVNFYANLISTCLHWEKVGRKFTDGAHWITKFVAFFFMEDNMGSSKLERTFCF